MSYLKLHWFCTSKIQFISVQGVYVRAYIGIINHVTNWILRVLRFADFFCFSISVSFTLLTQSVHFLITVCFNFISSTMTVMALENQDVLCGKLILIMSINKFNKLFIFDWWFLYRYYYHITQNNYFRKILNSHMAWQHVAPIRYLL